MFHAEGAALSQASEIREAQSLNRADGVDFRQRLRGLFGTL